MHLEVQNTCIEELDGRVFAALKNLVSLKASKNYLKSLSCKIGACSRLQSIHLDNNSLTALPPEIGALA